MIWLHAIVQTVHRNTFSVWIDTNHLVMHAEAHQEHPGIFQATLELWRKADEIIPAEADHVTWRHFNSCSMHPSLLRHEHLEPLTRKYPDPLLPRCFGVKLTGPGLVSTDDHTLKSWAAGQDFRLDLIALTQRRADSVQIWQSNPSRLFCVNHAPSTMNNENN